LVVKDNLDGELAQRYQEALEQVGLLCEQQPMLSLMPLEEIRDQELYRCPACDTQQPLSGGQYDICSKCGVVRQRYEEVKAQKDLLDKEHRKFRQGLEWEARQEQEDRKQKIQRRRETAIRRMFEKMYEVDRFSRLRRSLFSRQGAIAAGVLVLVIGGAGAWFVIQQQQSIGTPAVTAQPVDPAAAPAFGSAQQLQQTMAAVTQAANQTTTQMATQTVTDPTTGNDAPGGKEVTLVGGGQAGVQQPEALGPTMSMEGDDSRGLVGPVSPAAVPGPFYRLVSVSALGTGQEDALLQGEPSDRVHVRAAAVLGTVAVDQAQAGNLAAAQDYLARAWSRLKEIGDPLLRERMGQTLGYYRSLALGELGRRQALGGDIPAAQNSFIGALEIVAELDSVVEQAAAYGFIARCLVVGGDELTGDQYFQQALATAVAAILPLERVSALVEVASQARLADRQLLAAQVLSRAEEALGKVRQPLERALGLGLLARYRAARLDGSEVQPLFAEAAAAAQGVEDPTIRRQLIARLFAFQAEALAMAARQRGHGQEEQALRAVATAWRRALEVDDPQLRAMALSHVALGFAAAGDRDRSRQVFEQALGEVPEA
ncbi:MAG: hypothetical protein R3310_14790, partial [Candidatus Competibacteraceae bacterium]|nr:hypothetical protein [Candidatus Competibacteraceae bacterium]